MQLQPRHYQIDGIEYLTTPNVLASQNDLAPTLCRHILTDAPGAGKTFQSTEAALQLAEPHQSIMILCPAHLAEQWFDFLCSQYPDYTTVWLEGTAKNRAQDARVPAKFYIATIQSLRQQSQLNLLIDLFIHQHINVSIIDESHYIKNRDAVQSKNVRTLTRPDFCKHVILLTATPVVREADDLYMQLRVCDPIQFRSFDRFLNTYCWFSYSNWGPQDVTLRRDAPKLLSNWMMGRSYAQIGLELPPLISSVELAPISKARRDAYERIKTYWPVLIQGASVDEPDTHLTANNAMEIMHMLRRIISCPEKLTPLTDFMTTDPGPFVVACIYRSSAQELSAAIQTAYPHFQVTVITGETPAEDRARLARQATSTPNSCVVATIPSLSEGCDLSHCNTVYFYEEDFTPGKMYQFLSRVRRHRAPTDTSVTITEDRQLILEPDRNLTPVLVRYFNCKQTIDERIHAVQSHRGVAVKDLIKVELGL